MIRRLQCLSVLALLLVHGVLVLSEGSQNTPGHTLLPPANSKRLDSPNEAPAMEISAVLLQAKTLSVACGDDVDAQTCKFFFNALSFALQKKHISVSLLHEPDALAPSFFVEPRPFLSPSSYQVTLRLVEKGPPQAVSLFVGGFCFDLSGSSQQQFQLPEWVQAEGGADYGPLEADKAQAASRLARTFAAYWGSASVKSNCDPHKQKESNPGSTPIPNEAISIRDAAECDGNAEAQFKMGMMYHDGQVMDQDDARAVYWWTKAANQGNAAAQSNLGMSYQEGRGVGQDYSRAYFWFSVAASGNGAGLDQTDLKSLRDYVASHLKSDERFEIDRKVAKWLEKHPANAAKQ